MASFSTVYSMNREITQADREECIKLTNDLGNYTYRIPYENCDPQVDANRNDVCCQYISDNRDLIESLVIRMENLLTKYPHEESIQRFIPMYNNLVEILEGLIAAEEN